MSNLPRPVIAWSHSALDMFENCPRKFWAVRVKKLVSDGNKWNQSGDNEHKAFDRYLKKGTPLPAFLTKFTPMLDRVKATPGTLYSEFSMALTQDFRPCSGTDWDVVWVRAISDVLIVDGPLAINLDWKTGKVSNKPAQMKLGAAVIFRTFPQVQEVRGAYVFTNHEAIEPVVTQRYEESVIWGDYLPRVKRMEQAKLKDEWPATPNPLCGYCPYKACPHNKNPESPQ